MNQTILPLSILFPLIVGIGIIVVSGIICALYALADRLDDRVGPYLTAFVICAMVGILAATFVGVVLAYMPP
jgi:hypothetical protein